MALANPPRAPNFFSQDLGRRQQTSRVSREFHYLIRESFSEKNFAKRLNYGKLSGLGFNF